jgi:hypothetical protein
MSEGEELGLLGWIGYREGVGSRRLQRDGQSPPGGLEPDPFPAGSETRSIPWGAIAFTGDSRKGNLCILSTAIMSNPEDPGVVLAQTVYGGETYCSGLRYKNVFGFQFHPERSGPGGIGCLSELGPVGPSQWSLFPLNWRYDTFHSARYGLPSDVSFLSSLRDFQPTSLIPPSSSKIRAVRAQDHDCV